MGPFVGPLVGVGLCEEAHFDEAGDVAGEEGGGPLPERGAGAGDAVEGVDFAGFDVVFGEECGEAAGDVEVAT